MATSEKVSDPERSAAWELYKSKTRGDNIKRFTKLKELYEGPFKGLWADYKSTKPEVPFKDFLDEKFGFIAYRDEAYEKYHEKVGTEDEEQIDEGSIESWWEELSPEEKAKYMPKSEGISRRIKTSSRRLTRS